MELATTEILLRDGREMVVALAGAADAGDIVAGLPLPRQMDASPAVYRSYFRIKTEIYMHAPGAGIVCGRVNNQLAGFIFFCADLAAVTQFMQSRAMKWRVLRSIFLEELGCNPFVLLQMLRWARQHTHSSATGEEDIPAWVGTVHTLDNFRRNGVASALLDAVEGILFEAGCPEVALWVSTENPAAVSLYEKTGYMRRRVVPRIDEECWLMSKELSQHVLL